MKMMGCLWFAFGALLLGGCFLGPAYQPIRIHSLPIVMPEVHVSKNIYSSDRDDGAVEFNVSHAAGGKSQPFSPGEIHLGDISVPGSKVSSTHVGLAIYDGSISYRHVALILLEIPIIHRL
jgi:hypothetical protein